MKFNWNDDDQKYIKLGLTAFTVVVLSILANQVLHQIPILTVGVRKLFECMRPIIYGLIFAYILVPALNLLERIVYWALGKFSVSPNRHARGIIRFACVLVTWGLTLAMLAVLVRLVVPEIISSIDGIVANISTEVNKLIQWVAKILENNREFRSNIILQIRALYSDFSSLMGSLSNIMDNIGKLMPNTGSFVASFSSGVVSAVSVVFHFVIGVIVSIYVMSSKERFVAQTKKLMYGLMPAHRANSVIGVARSAHIKFGGFLIGKIIDSIVIGILCFILLSIFRIPYAVLVSFVVGVTNIIPFFGPFIGAIPCAIILLLASPLKCLYFIIIIIVLQQVDGNILGPKILSSSIGLSSFWVMFSILVFGGFFGFWGLLCGVPVFAVIYELISEFINRRLRHKNLPVATDDYSSLDRVDTETGELIKMKEKDEANVSESKQK